MSDMNLSNSNSLTNYDSSNRSVRNIYKFATILIPVCLCASMYLPFLNFYGSTLSYIDLAANDLLLISSTVILLLLTTLSLISGLSKSLSITLGIISIILISLPITQLLGNMTDLISNIEKLGIKNEDPLQMISEVINIGMPLMLISTLALAVRIFMTARTQEY
ncbi:hypothetical protein [Maricurvus nonylphenolicus]|uniref:hypothetical protein n=1 Tax=Maricurvus nonylphenolicus TaxID=1008307 RepID=UPI0036F3C934